MGHSVGQTDLSLTQSNSSTCLSLAIIPEGLGAAGGQCPVISGIKRERYRNISLSVYPEDEVKPAQMGCLAPKMWFVFALCSERASS